MIETQPTNSLTHRIRSLIEEEKISLPPLPAIGTKILATLQDECTGADDVAKLIQHEPAVAATILKMANSAGVFQVKETFYVER